MISETKISSNTLFKIYIINSTNRKKTIMVTGVMLSILILPSLSSLAYTQYIPSSGQTGLDDYLDLAKKESRWQVRIHMWFQVPQCLR